MIDDRLIKLMVRTAEQRPCACGKRKTSEPQTVASEIDQYEICGEPHASCTMRCGVCRELHEFETLLPETPHDPTD